MELFENCLNFLEKIYDNKNEKINNKLICQLYCIAYIKIYLYKYIYYNHNMPQRLIEVDKINEVIEGTGNSNVRKIIQIYIFKIFFYLFNNDFQILQNYPYDNHKISFFVNFREQFNVKIESMLNYYLLPRGEEYNKYEEEFEIFDSYRKNEFNNPVNEFKEYIENHGIDIFYTISSNLIISKLGLNENNYNEYSKYSLFAKNLFDNQLQLPEVTKKLFLLFSNEDVFNTIKPITDEGHIDKESLEILLYGLRICLQTSNTNNPNILYYELLNENAEKIINENVIPGNIFSNTFIEGYKNIQNHFKKYGSNVGAYVCSCGKYYIVPSGFTSISSLCVKCNLPIGNIEGEKHGNLIKREGHYRIFKNNEEKEIEVNRYGDKDYDQKTPNMLLDEYKNKIIDQIIENNKFGISKMSQDIFIDSNQNARNLSIVGFRLLHFILYSHLFYSNCLGFITNENLSKYICDEMTCLKMLVEDWILKFVKN